MNDDPCIASNRETVCCVLAELLKYVCRTSRQFPCKGLIWIYVPKPQLKLKTKKKPLRVLCPLLVDGHKNLKRIFKGNFFSHIYFSKDKRREENSILAR